MKKVLICIVLAVALISGTKAKAASPPAVVADGALLIDANTGTVLYEKNQHQRFYPASTTKIMTALLVLENCRPDDKVVIGKNPASFIDGSKIYIFENEIFTADQLLHALLIASANDVAVAFAEHLAGSVEAFADMMNKRAKQLGCLDTHFANPHGLFDQNHYTTAYDLSLIAREAMKYDEFRQIVNTKSYIMAPTNRQPEPRPINTNVQIILNTKYHVDGANGIKVGYTTESGHSFVGSAYRDDTKLMVVLLHDRKPGLWEDASALLNYGFDNYCTKKALSKGDIVSHLTVSNSDTEIPLAAADDFYYTYPLNQAAGITNSVVITGNYKSIILKGQKVGYLEYRDSNSVIGRLDLIAATEFPVSMVYNYSSGGYTIKRSSSPWITATMSGFLTACLLLSFGIIKRKRKGSASQ